VYDVTVMVPVARPAGFDMAGAWMGSGECGGEALGGVRHHQ